jgi:hypothetical protein
MDMRRSHGPNLVPFIHYFITSISSCAIPAYAGMAHHRNPGFFVAYTAEWRSFREQPGWKCAATNFQPPIA